MVSTVKSFDELPRYAPSHPRQAVLGLSTGKAYQLMHSEGFPTQRFGRRVMVLKADFIKWLEQNKGQSRER